jgi:hypothetical protein
MRKGACLILGTYILGFWGAALGETFETFRGIQWGADKKEVSGLLAGPQRENVEVYTRNENKRVGDIEVESIYYLFYKGKFGAAMINFQGDSHYSFLKEALRQKYGPGEKTDPSAEKYTWALKDLKIILSFSRAKARGSIDYFFQPVVQRREKDKTEAGRQNTQKRIDDL